MLTFLYTLWILYTAGTLSLIILLFSLSFYNSIQSKKRIKEFEKLRKESNNDSEKLKEESW
jgi:uncharacterized membrane protein